MTTVNQVREALAEAAAVTGLRMTDFIVPDINPPVGMVNRPAYDPRMVLGQSHVALPFTITVYAQRDIEVTAQKLLEEYADVTGTKSILAAVQDETNWPDQLIAYCVVTEISEIGAARIAEGIEYLTVRLTVEVCW